MLKNLRSAGQIIRAAALISAALGTFSRLILSHAFSGGADVFGYFTVQSNIMVVVYLLAETLLMIYRRRNVSADSTEAGRGEAGADSGSGNRRGLLPGYLNSGGNPSLNPVLITSIIPSVIHGAVLLYILITGLVFNTMLAPSVDSSGYDFLVIHLNHSITPLLFLLDWLVNRPRGSHHWHQLGVWLIYPVGYALFASLEGAARGNFRYFFLDFTQPPAAYLVQIISVVGIFVLAAWVIIFINRRIVPERHGD